MQNQSSKQISRSVTLANNWKSNELKLLNILRKEMITNKIDEQLIKEYVDEQYTLINKKYEDKIKKYNNKEKNLKVNPKITKAERKKAIDFIMKNKQFLEENGAPIEYINNYVEKHYESINNRFLIKNKENDFISNNWCGIYFNWYFFEEEQSKSPFKIF